MHDIGDSLLDAMSDGVLVTDARGRIVRANPLLATMLGTRAERLVGRFASDAVPVRGEWSTDSLLEPPTDGVDGRLQVADGTHRLVHVRFRSLADDARLYVIEDRTELRKLRHRLAYADRLANAGTLAASWLVGLDVPLMAAERCCGPTMTTARVRLQRATALLADPWSAEDTTDLSAIARGLTVAAAGAELELELTDLPRVALTPSLARQALANLVDNARRARARKIRIAGIRDAERVVVSIVDDGEGLAVTPSAAVLPYYTTRSGAQGLGLTVVRDIVEDAGGALELSPDDRGTRVTLILPVAATVVPEIVSEPEPTPTRRVLVVDDEPAVLRMVSRVLGRADIEVVGVRGGREALERLGTGERFDAILCDVEMPEIDGLELARRVARDHPELAGRVALLSGSAVTLSAALGASGGPRLGLTKPFRTAALRDLLEQLLREGATH